MADYSDYYSTMARAISGLPGKTEEARGAVYELARTALQKRLGALDPQISETDLAIERFALEAAIQRVETESRFSDTRHGLSFMSMAMQFVRSVRGKLNINIAIRRDGLTSAITTCLAQGLEFIQSTNIFRDRRWTTKHPQIRIALRYIVAALIGILAGIFLFRVT